MSHDVRSHLIKSEVEQADIKPYSIILEFLFREGNRKSGFWQRGLAYDGHGEAFAEAGLHGFSSKACLAHVVL